MDKERRKKNALVGKKKRWSKDIKELYKMKKELLGDQNMNRRWQIYFNYL